MLIVTFLITLSDLMIFSKVRRQDIIQYGFKTMTVQIWWIRNKNLWLR